MARASSFSNGRHMLWCSVTKNRNCSEVECDSIVLARGLCGQHYNRARNAGQLKGIKRYCKIADCGVAVLARGFCSPHYYAAQRDGELGTTCKEAGCSKGVLSHGRCSCHHGQAVRSGAFGVMCIVDGCRGYSLTVSKRGVCDSCRGRIRRYRLSVSELSRLLRGTPCDLCSVSLASHVDRCHKTGAVRGFLCGPCNMSLGAFNDDPDKLRAAAEYLDRKSPQIHPGVAS